MPILQCLENALRTVMGNKMQNMLKESD